MNFVRNAYEIFDTPIIDARWTLVDWVGVCFVCVVHSALSTIFLECVVSYIYGLGFGFIFTRTVDRSVLSTFFSGTW